MALDLGNPVGNVAFDVGIVWGSWHWQWYSVGQYGISCGNVGNVASAVENMWGTWHLMKASCGERGIQCGDPLRNVASAVENL